MAIRKGGYLREHKDATGAHCVGEGKKPEDREPAQVDRLNDICRIGQGAATCRYLMIGSQGFECVKLDPQLSDAVDRRVAGMIAQAINCEGIEPGTPIT